MWTTAEIRQTFLEYFRERDHKIVPSSPLVPHQDPSLLFTNAGMVPFKNYFTGLEVPPYLRATSSQKCVRAGGKHNDLENVGYTARHHTFFEMLGNFSFGDYFKEEAIEFAWHFVRKVLNLPKDRLLVTVFHTDEEAARLWHKIAGLGEDRLLRIKGSDNFWSMGDVGPCGPCSEIFFDHGPAVPGGPPGSPDAEGDRFVEIWNLVFMQYEQLASEEGAPGKDKAPQRKDLPKPSIDTGCGLERLAAVLQGKHTTYDCDLFRHLIQACEDVSQVKAAGDTLVSHRVIADHLRASGFLIADGVMPSNEGRGYVLRRILRRAMRHASLLGCQEPLLYKLVPALISEMGAAFPELNRGEALITQTLQAEEDRFRVTLGKGLKLLSQASAHLSDQGELPGDIAFRLYDTYGFPLDLTQDILRQEGKTVDVKGFEEAMQHQKEEARGSWPKGRLPASGEIWPSLSRELTATAFLGYHVTHAEGSLQALVLNDQAVSKVEGTDQHFFFVCHQTPFYAESGGQVGDTGTASTSGGATVRITNTIKQGSTLFVHEALLIQGTLAVGDTLHLCVDAQRRQQIKAHHSATHLLHKVLRDTLGDHVVQKGSLVAPDRLRFDFSHRGPLTRDQLASIEAQVNSLIRGNTDTQTRLMTPQEALDTGAMALFGEKYGEEVRVVFMGGDSSSPSSKQSIEFCGGTHVDRTGDIGTFKILLETGVAAGIRRLEAVTGEGAEAYMRDQEALLKTLSERFKTNVAGLLPKVEQLLESHKALTQEVKKLQKKLSDPRVENGPSQESEQIGDVTLISRSLKGVRAKELKPLADQLRQSHPEGVIALAGEYEGKASLVVSLSPDLVSRGSAIDLVKVGAAVVGGQGGGGRPDMAQAGGPAGAKIHEALHAIRDALKHFDS